MGRPARLACAATAVALAAALAHNIAERYAAGGYIRWEGLRIDYVETPPSSGGVLSTVRAFSAPMTLKDSSARPEQHPAGRRVTYLVGVKSRPSSSLDERLG